MRIRLTNIVLNGRSGTEVVTIELARGLVGRGHQVAVFTPFIGPSASALLTDGITVTDRPEHLPWKPDVIHGHHNIAVAMALARYLDVPALFVMHDAIQGLDNPLVTPQIVRFFAVDEINRESHLRGTSLRKRDIELLPNAVDLSRFHLRDPLPQRPRRALLFGKSTGHIDTICEAARTFDLSLDAIGPVFGRVVDDLHVRLKDYDIVFATGRMALEALAVGCAVIVCDHRGFAGLARSDSVDEWRNNNFGLKLLTKPTTIDALLAEMCRYTATDAALVSMRIREIASLSDYLDRVEMIHREIVTHWKCAADDLRRHSEALSIFMAEWLRGLSFEAVSGVLENLLAHQAAALAERDAVIARRDAAVAQRDAVIAEHNTILNSRSGLMRQLWHVSKRKLRLVKHETQSAAKSIS